MCFVIFKNENNIIYANSFGICVKLRNTEKKDSLKHYENSDIDFLII